VGHGGHKKVCSFPMLTCADFGNFRHFMAKELTRRIAARREARIAAGFDPEPEVVYMPWWKLRVFSRKPTPPSDAQSSTEDNERGQRLKTDMIRRMHDAPQRVTPSGFLSETTTIQEISRGPAHRQPLPSLSRQSASVELPATMDLPEAVDTTSSNVEDEDSDSKLDETGGRSSFRSRPITRSKYGRTIL
jgi:hypothetical protein